LIAVPADFNSDIGVWDDPGRSNVSYFHGICNSPLPRCAPARRIRLGLSRLFIPGAPAASSAQ
jgi:hypothetical protein